MLVPPALILLYVDVTLFHKWTGFVANMWFRLVVWLIEVQGGTKFVFAGDKVLPEAALMMSNHRTRLDWMLLWSLFVRAGTLHMLRIVLKAGLKKAPAFGFVMQTLGFMFLERNWDKDKVHMEGMCDTYAAGDPFQLLIFPEGSDLSESNLAKSHKWAEENGATKYMQILQPRTKGYALCHNHLKKSIKAVYDITLAFPDKVPQTEKVIFDNDWPKEIHVHVRRIPIEEVPEDVETWVKERFAEKETVLAAFQKNKGFRDTKTNCAGVGYAQPDLNSALAFWGIVSIAFLQLMWGSILFRWWCLVALILQVGVTLKGGVDKMEVELLHKAQGKIKKPE